MTQDKDLVDTQEVPNFFRLFLWFAAQVASAQEGRNSGALDVLNLPMLFRGPQPALEVMVNGEGPFLFAIDTGATEMARVDSSLVERLGLRLSGTEKTGDGYTRTRVDKTKLKSLRVGPIELHNVAVTSRNFNRFPNLPHIDGLLTFGLFSEYLLTLDYPAKRVRIEKGSLPPANGANILELKRVKGLPAVDIELGEIRLTAFIDTGNLLDGFFLPGPVVSKLPLLDEPANAGTAQTVSNQWELKTARLRKSIQVGGVEFLQPVTTFPTLFKQASIGSRLLRDYSVTFDQRNRRLRLCKKNGTCEQRF